VDVQITKLLHLSLFFQVCWVGGVVVWGWLYLINSLQIKQLYNSFIICKEYHQLISGYDFSSVTIIEKGPSWSWSDGSWICNQCISSLLKCMSSDPDHGELYSNKLYVIKFVSDFRQFGYFHRVLRFPPPIKLTATI